MNDLISTTNVIKINVFEIIILRCSTKYWSLFESNEFSNVFNDRRNNIEILFTLWNRKLHETKNMTKFRFDDTKLRYISIFRWFSMTLKTFYVIVLNLILSMIHSIENVNNSIKKNFKNSNLIAYDNRFENFCYYEFNNIMNIFWQIFDVLMFWNNEFM